jgi:hypothetical protein
MCLSSSGHGPKAGSCECCNDPSGTIKGEEFSYGLTNYWNMKKGSVNSLKHDSIDFCITFSLLSLQIKIKIWAVHVHVTLYVCLNSFLTSDAIS